MTRSGTYGNYQTSYYEKRASRKKLRMRESQYKLFSALPQNDETKKKSFLINE